MSRDFQDDVEEQIYQYVDYHIETYGVTPTLREMSTAMGYPVTVLEDYASVSMNLIVSRWNALTPGDATMEMWNVDGDGDGYDYSKLDDDDYTWIVDEPEPEILMIRD